MNKLLVIYGCFCLGGTPSLVEQWNQEVLDSPTANKMVKDGMQALPQLEMNHGQEWGASDYLQPVSSLPLSSGDIQFEELDAPVDLGFDTSRYLPDGFNPFIKGFDMRTVEFEAAEELPLLGFDSKAFLPDGFNAYANTVSISTIQFMELEEEDAFNSAGLQHYLPEGFDPHSVYFDISTLHFIDGQESGELGIEVKNYLPVDFNPYEEKKVSIPAIHFMELPGKDEYLGFDTRLYLSKDFDPYKGLN